MKIRQRLILNGQVQGVGFRPFVYVLTQELSLAGFVKNAPDGVVIEVQGNKESIEAFKERLITDLPPLARILSLEYEDIDCLTLNKDNENFKIIQTEKGDTHTLLISPDVAHCELCKSEMLDKENSRYLYPFINCTHCGPRFSITHSMPYDRETTSMACFPLCESCLEEYTNPLDRRFHAQPTACPQCGVDVWTDTGKKNTEAIHETLENLHQGKIVAIKGLGGFHLACDAMNEEAILTLRKRKSRPHKALAIMLIDIEKAREVAYINEEEEKLLTQSARPIVICKRKEGVLPSILSPDTDTIGIMLPASPLHELFFHAEHFNLPNFHALVMTSANPAQEPICLGNREAREKLSHIADAFLFHNRDILVRVDDSVLFSYPNEISKENKDSFINIRRARGFVPSPISLPIPASQHKKFLSTKEHILAFGADLKGTCCLTKTSKNAVQAFVGQHVGDSESIKNQKYLLETIEHFEKILAVKPTCVIADAHPNAYTRNLAEEYALEKNIPCHTVQHHIAHAFALCADTSTIEPCLVLVLDGTGYGLDSSLWGGELFYIDPLEGLYERVGHFEKVLQPANDMAVRKPWYMTKSYFRSIGKSYNLKEINSFEQNAVEELCTKRVGIETSSCGRFLDACGVLLGCSSEISYEGQVPIQLETMQDFSYKNYTLMKPLIKEEFLLFNSLSLFNLCAELKESLCVEKVSRHLHLSLAHSLALWAYEASKKYKVSKVGMTGGVFLNRTLLLHTSLALKNYNLNPLIHKNYSPSDASISLGQTFYMSLKI